MRIFFFFSERSFDVKAPFYMWMRWYLFRFVIIIHCKNCYFVLKRSFVWLKKIVFDESFYEIVLLLIQFFSCMWLLLFLRAVVEPMCKCLVWFEVFFLFIWWFFFQCFDEIQSQFFFHCFFVRFLCLVSLRRRGRFFSRLFVKKKVLWMNWIVCWLSCRRICFFFWFQFFWTELKKFIVWKKFFYVSFFIYRKHGWKKISRQNKRVWKKGMFIYKRLWYS